MPGGEDMVWKVDMSYCKFSVLKPGYHVMGDVNILGWVVLKCTSVDLKDVVDCVSEKKANLKEFADGGPWRDIKGSWKQMQFEELKCVSASEKDIFSKFTRSHYMKYNTTSVVNIELATNYPVLNGLFGSNNALCDTYLKCELHIDCNYVSGGCNFLINNNGIEEQIMHTDYDGMAFGK